MQTLQQERTLDELLQQELKPLVRKVDEEAYYAESFLLQLGRDGWLSSEGLTVGEAAAREVQVVHAVSANCMTTGFNLWCHLAALTYVRHTENEALRARFLPALENGELLGATGLSNPMKYYAGLEKLHLNAERVSGGYVLNGALPAVSNLGKGHWFGAIAAAGDDQRIMAFVSCDAEGVSLKEKTAYLGLNGSATYACRLQDVFVPDEEILSEDADTFVPAIRPYFVTYQVPLGLGVTEAAIASMNKCRSRQHGANQLLPVQPEDLQERLDQVTADFTQQLDQGVTWKGMLEVRRKAVYLTLDAVNAAMMHTGGPAYLQASPDGRRLREAFFFLNLTPTAKHLEKMLQA
ncbi:acyl-CoA dehydrogenase family protein [Alkalicoccus chagannorensis]|uniref:acyl-CoA dehydrogenase family protein n=1 Tax=Alkalicoccus chagannorensis TaxID=427072 RepID=UPI0003FDEA13|nr:acyl-CoA dehydrogenase family protein [Alkalicoccus chagannorensis]